MIYLLQISASVVLENLVFLFTKLYPIPCQPFTTSKEVTRVSEVQTEGMKRSDSHKIHRNLMTKCGRDKIVMKKMQLRFTRGILSYTFSHNNPPN